MALNTTIQLEDISAMPAANVAGVVIINCPRGYRYRKIRLKFGASNTANNAAVPITLLGEIQVKAGGGIQRRCNAVRMDAINALNGAQFASRSYPKAVGASGRRHLTIFFEESWRTRIRAQSVDTNALGFKTGWLPSNKPLQISVAIPALGVGVTAVLSAEADVSDDDDGQPSPIVKWNTDEANVGGVTANIANVDNGLKTGEGILQISAFNTTGNVNTVTQVRFEAGGRVIKQDQGIDEINTELRHADMDPDAANALANAAHLVFDQNDALDDALKVGFGSSLLKFTLSGANGATLPYVTQVVGMPNMS